MVCMLSNCQAVPLQHHKNAIIEGNKITSNHEEEIKEITWENSRHLTFPPLISPQNEVWETCMSTRALSVVMRYMYHYLDLGSGSDWLCNTGNSNQLTRSIPCEQRLHFRCVSWRAKSSLCRQPFKSVQKSGRINLENGFFSCSWPV